MSFLGIRCSNNDFSYVVLSGTKEQPKIELKDSVVFPKGYSRSQSLKWFLQELEEIYKKDPNIRLIGIKGAEPMASRGKSFVARVENEAMVFFFAGKYAINPVYRKTKPTIAKDLGLKGKGKYLDTLDCSVFPDYDNEKEKIKEAILVAWSCIK